jgi:hypothetical protein
METPEAVHNPHAPQIVHAQQAIAIPERRQFIPAWCPWKAFYSTPGAPELETKVWKGRSDRPEPVTSLGVEIRVKDVLPERRFAIEPDGRLRDNRDFWELLELKYVDTFVLAGVKQVGDPSLIAKPTASEWVSWGVDPVDARKRRQIGHDPNKKPPAAAHRRSELDAIKDPVAMAAPGLMPVPDGVVKEKAGTVDASPEQKIQAAKTLHEAGILDDTGFHERLRRIAEDAGWVVPQEESGGTAPEVPKAGSSPASSATADTTPLDDARDAVAATREPQKDGIRRTYKTKCGREFSKPAIVRRHEHNCAECGGTID